MVAGCSIFAGTPLRAVDASTCIASFASLTLCARRLCTNDRWRSIGSVIAEVFHHVVHADEVHSTCLRLCHGLFSPAIELSISLGG